MCPRPPSPTTADLLALPDAPVTHRRVGRDAGAQQRRHPGEVEVFRYAQDETLVDDDALGVTAVGDAAEMLVGRVVREDPFGTELLHVRTAAGAGVIRVDEATHADEFARLVLGDLRADRGDLADDLVTRHHRIHRRHDLGPFIPRRMQVGVTDPAEEDLDLYVRVRDVAAFDRIGRQRGRGAGCGVGFGFGHRCASCWS